LFTKKGEPWFCIAGIWRLDKDVGEAFTMLTMARGPDIAPYHDWQIAILDRVDWAALARSVYVSEDDLEAAPGRHSRRRPEGLGALKSRFAMRQRAMVTMRHLWTQSRAPAINVEGDFR
jgi:hypothetical protein